MQVSSKILLLILCGMFQGCQATKPRFVYITFPEPIVSPQQEVTLPDGTLVNIPEPATWTILPTRFEVPPGQATPELSYVDEQQRTHTARFFVTGHSEQDTAAKPLEITRYRADGTLDVISYFNATSSLPDRWTQYSPRGDYPTLTVYQAVNNDGEPGLLRLTVYKSDSYMIAYPSGQAVSESSTAHRN